MKIKNPLMRYFLSLLLKTTTLSLVLFISSHALFASEQVNNKIDSISLLIEKENGIDQLELMLLLIEELSTVKPELAESTALKAIYIADSLQEEKIHHLALRLLRIHYYDQKEIHKADSIIRVSLKRSIVSDNHAFILQDQLALAEIYSERHNFDSALILLDQSELNAIKNNIDNFLPAIYNNKAKLFDEIGDYISAIELYLQSAEIYENTEENIELAIAYNNIGVVHLNLENYKNAIPYFKKAILLNKTSGELLALNMNYNNLGVTYMDYDSLKLSQKYFLKSIQLSKQLHNDFELARLYMNYGNLMKQQSLYKLAESYYDSSLLICKENDLSYGIILNNINSGSLYLEKGEAKKALNILQDCELTLQKFNLPDKKAKVYELLAEAYKNTAQYEKALNYFQKYIKIDDSISGNHINKTILELSMKFDQEKSKKEIANLQNQLLTEKNQHQLYFISFLISALIVLSLGYFAYFKQRSSNYRAKITIQENENLLLSMELKDKQLVSKAMHLARIKEIIWSVEVQMKDLMGECDASKSSDLRQMIRQLKTGLPNESIKEFETLFEQINQSFFQKLINQFPQLSPAEIKLCGFLKLNLTTKDIATLSNRSSQTINNSRSSIRKKINLENDDSLVLFLSKL